MSEIRVEESKAVPVVRAKVSAASMLTFLSAGFILFLLTTGIFSRPVTNPPSFPLFWASGAAATKGLNPYLAYPDTFYTHDIIGRKIRPVAEINLNPPSMLPFFQALSHLPIQRYAHVWAVGSFLMLLGTVALLMWNRPEIQKRQIIWLLLSAPAIITLTGNQIYFFLFLLCTLALLSVESGGKTGAVIAIGLVVAIKPTMAYWPFFLFFGGYRRLSLRAFGVALAFSTAPLLLYGPRVYREWMNAVARDDHWISSTNMAIPAYFGRLGFRSVSLVLAVVLAIFLAWLAYKKKPGFVTISCLALCAGILCAPISWVDYALLLAPYFLSRRWNIFSTLAAALLMVPPVVAGTLSRPDGKLGMAMGSGIYFAAFWMILIVFTRRIGSQSNCDAALV